MVAGCATGLVTASGGDESFSVAPGTGFIDTNCTGCNAANSKGAPVEQFSATFSNGDPAAVVWSVAGGDARSGAGSISRSGQYTPPSYLTADRAQVVITATLNAQNKVSAMVTLTPGFLQPLTPENAALGPGGQTTITGFLSEAGGHGAISFTLSNSPNGTRGGDGSLSVPNCQCNGQAFTFCSVTYTAPATISSTGVTYVVASAGSSGSWASAALLLNSAGVSSSPSAHQAQLTPLVQLGASGGNSNDYDQQGNQVADCCGGTLGALLQDASGRQYLLSNNHVLARSDQGGIGDAIVQPGLIDDNCTPLGDGTATAQVASLSAWLPLSSKSSNVDAAIAQVVPGTVDPTGSILELGSRQPDGTIGAAPPGISSTGGKGEAATLGQLVAKSGRTTGLTCTGVSAINVDVNVDYYQDCAETRPYLTKTFTNQLAVSGNQFSDAGDSGSLVVDATNAEPVGLFFAGGVDALGVSQGMANPAIDVLSELGTQTGAQAGYSFVGTADHAVNCLNYGDNTLAAAQARTLSDAEQTRAQLALTQARLLVNPQAGVLGVATGKSSDHPGEAAILVDVDEGDVDQGKPPAVPSTVEGVRTVVISTTAHAVANGSAPQMPQDAEATLPTPILRQAVAIKQQLARILMRQNPAFFAIGVGQSLDNPQEAALVIYVDRKNLPDLLPAVFNGIRTRYIVMERLHVTRSYAAPTPSQGHCMRREAASTVNFDPDQLREPAKINLE